jgi:hypothetical protein
MAPEQSAGVKLPIRQLFPAVAASLDDSDVAAVAQETIEETKQIFPSHRRSSFLSLRCVDSTPEVLAAAFWQRPAMRLHEPKPLGGGSICGATMEQGFASDEEWPSGNGVSRLQ